MLSKELKRIARDMQSRSARKVKADSNQKVAYKDVAKATLTIDVVYDLNGTDSLLIKEILSAAAKQIGSQGLLVEKFYPRATVDTWDYRVDVVEK